MFWETLRNGLPRQARALPRGKCIALQTLSNYYRQYNLANKRYSVQKDNKGGRRKSGITCTKAQTHSKHNLAKLANMPPSLCLLSTLILINNDLLSHTLHDLCIKLDGMIPWEANLLGQIIGQDVDEISVPVRIEQWFVGEFCFLVAES